MKDPASGEVTELRCTFDPETRSGTGTSTKKVKGTIHWSLPNLARLAEVRLYDRLFSVEDPGSVKEGDWHDTINANSLEILSNAKIEPALSESKPGDKMQFERLGYFCVDKNATADNLIFNRTVSLRDSWAKIKKGL